VAKRGTKEIRKGSDEGRRVGLTKDLRRVKHLHEQLDIGCVIIPDTQEEEEEEEEEEFNPGHTAWNPKGPLHSEPHDICRETLH